MSVLMSLFAALIEITKLVLGLYIWVLIVSAVLSWLVAFDIVNNRNRFVQSIGELCSRLTEPLLRPIRRFIPLVGGLDLSPVVLIFAIMFIQSFLAHLLAY
ncbi:MAG: YggT family protein [Bdellovibrionales bacterium]